MATAQSTSLKVAPRDPSGSRSARRLRRSGEVPGVVYGGGEDPVAFSVNARELRLALANAGAVLDLDVGGSTTPAVVKELERHPVTGETVHLDLLRVRLDQKIQTTVVLELVGAEEAPGVVDSGILEQVTRELNIEALPTDIPDSIQHDVSSMQMNDTLTLDALQAPGGVELLDDLETVIATITPPRLQIEAEEEIEAETELVGEGEGEGGEEGEAGEEGAASDEGGDSGSDSE
jgi:large subunit ribosomal protein L25